MRDSWLQCSPASRRQPTRSQLVSLLPPVGICCEPRKLCTQSAMLGAVAKTAHQCTAQSHSKQTLMFLTDTQPLAVCTRLRPRLAGADARSLHPHWNLSTRPAHNHLGLPPVCTTLRPRKQVCPVSCSKSACTRRSRANSLHMRPWKACSLLCSRGARTIQPMAAVTSSQGISCPNPQHTFPRTACSRLCSRGWRTFEPRRPVVGVHSHLLRNCLWSTCFLLVEMSC